MKTNVENVEAQRRKAQLTMQRLAMVARSKDLTEQEHQEFDAAEQEVADCDEALKQQESGRCPAVASRQKAAAGPADVASYRHVAGNVYTANAPGRQALAGRLTATVAQPAPGSAEAFLAAHNADRDAAIAGKGGGPGTLQANLRAQLERASRRPAA